MEQLSYVPPAVGADVGLLDQSLSLPLTVYSRVDIAIKSTPLKTQLFKKVGLGVRHPSTILYSIEFVIASAHD
jgi:hypothetical protein